MVVAGDWSGRLMPIERLDAGVAALIRLFLLPLPPPLQEVQLLVFLLDVIVVFVVDVIGAAHVDDVVKEEEEEEDGRKENGRYTHGHSSVS